MADYKRKEAGKEPEPRPRCGTCHWYDGLGDLCTNNASPRAWNTLGRRERCPKWEAERE